MLCCALCCWTRVTLFWKWMVQIFRECNELVWVYPAWSSSVIDVILRVGGGCYRTEKCLCLLRKKTLHLCIVFAATNANGFPGHRLSWHIDIFAFWGVQPPWHFFFPLLYRLVGFDSSFNLCRVFFFFIFMFSLSTALFVWVSCMCVCVCCSVFARNVFGHHWFGCRAIFYEPSTTCLSPLVCCL